MLVQSYEAGKDDSAHWLNDYCQKFLAPLDRSKDVATPMELLMPEILEVYKLCPLWDGWSAVFYSVTCVLKAHPHVCRNMAGMIMPTLASILWNHEELERSVTLSTIDMFSFVVSHSPTQGGYISTVPDVATLTADHEAHARNFLFRVLVPLTHSLSQHSTTGIQSGWSWLIQFILVCIHEKCAKDEALLTLQVLLLFGHRSLGMWSASIIATIAKLMSSEDHAAGNFITSRLACFLQFVLLLKPNVYLNLVTHIRRIFPVGVMIRYGTDLIPLATVFTQPPRTTVEMWHWLEPTLTREMQFDPYTLDHPLKIDLTSDEE